MPNLVATHNVALKTNLYPMRTYLPKRQGWKAAFTVIEMLVVITIVVIMLALSTPALMRTLQASKLASAGDTLLGAISQAQQLASTNNLPIEIRFFKFTTDLDIPGARQDFRAYQVFQVKTAALTSGSALTESFIPIGGLVRLPDSITLVADVDLSPLLNGTPQQDTKNGASPGYSGVAGATFNALRFMPDGTYRIPGTASNSGLTSLKFAVDTTDITNCHVTLASDAGTAITKGNLPSNFYTIQIDPFTGKARTYRPGF